MLVAKVGIDTRVGGGVLCTPCGEGGDWLQGTLEPSDGSLSSLLLSFDGRCLWDISGQICGVTTDTLTRVITHAEVLESI